MNGIEKITGRIEAEAKAKAAEISAEAEAKASEIRAENEKKAQEKYWELIREGTADCEAMIAREKRMAEMESKKEILALKQDMVSESFDKACDMIINLPENEYVSFMARMAADAAASGSEEIVFNERDKSVRGTAVVKAANELLAAKGKEGKLTVADDTKNIMGGFVLRQGGIEINCSVETMVDLQRNDMASSLAAVLFE